MARRALHAQWKRTWTAPSGAAPSALCWPVLLAVRALEAIHSALGTGSGVLGAAAQCPYQSSRLTMLRCGMSGGKARGCYTRDGLAVPQGSRLPPQSYKHKSRSVQAHAPAGPSAGAGEEREDNMRPGEARLSKGRRRIVISASWTHPAGRQQPVRVRTCICQACVRCCRPRTMLVSAPLQHPLHCTQSADQRCPARKARSSVLRTCLCWSLSPCRAPSWSCCCCWGCWEPDRGLSRPSQATASLIGLQAAGVCGVRGRARSRRGTESTATTAGLRGQARLQALTGCRGSPPTRARPGLAGRRG
jgi:hypothetical protein